MNDQRTSRWSSSLRRILRSVSILPLGLFGCFVILIFAAGIRNAVQNYNPDVASFFGTFLSGAIFGAGIAVAISQYAVRLGTRSDRFSLQDIFVLMAFVAFSLGMVLYVINKL